MRLGIGHFEPATYQVVVQQKPRMVDQARAESAPRGREIMLRGRA